MRACSCCLEDNTWQWFHASLQEWHCCEMLQRGHQESISQDFYLFCWLPRKVSHFNVLVCPCTEQFWGSLLLPSGTKATAPVLIAWYLDQSSITPDLSETLLQDYLMLDLTCPMGNLCAWQVSERHNGRNYSQNWIPCANFGKNVLCHLEFLHQQSHNAS